MISKRLIAIANMVKEGMIVCDVGTDHTYLPIYLIESGKTDKAYAIDNKPGPLKQAEKSLKEHGLEDKITLILSDGLEKAPLDTECIVIAGMGGELIVSILEANLQRMENVREVIVQGNTSVQKIRQYISAQKYTILDENVVFDYKYYQIIKFNLEKSEGYSEEDIWLGPVLKEKKEKSYIDFLNKRLANLDYISGFHALDGESAKEYSVLKNYLAGL